MAPDPLRPHNLFTRQVKYESEYSRADTSQMISLAVHMLKRCSLHSSKSTSKRTPGSNSLALSQSRS